MLNFIIQSIIRCKNKNFYKADLSGANLSGVDLSGADLLGANLTGANLFRAITDIVQISSRFKYVITICPNTIWIGCKNKTLQQWIEYFEIGNTSVPKNERQKIIDICKIVFKIIHLLI